MGGGFAYVRGHGVQEATIDAALSAAGEFFALPRAEKARVATNANNRGWNDMGHAHMDGQPYADEKEFYQWGFHLTADDPEVVAGVPLRGANVWPQRPAAMQPAFEAFFAEIARVGNAALSALASSFGANEDFFGQRYAKPLQRSQAVYYPERAPGQAVEHFGVAPHTDYGAITFVAQQAGVGGLQVEHRSSGEWIDAPPKAGTLVANVGDLLERWSAGKLRSTKHRALNPADATRLSLVTFYDPSFDAVVDPRDLLGAAFPAAEASEDICTPITAGEHILGRIRRSITSSDEI